MISDEYRAQLEQLHREKEGFGTSSPIYAPIIRNIIRKHGPEGMLDYGAGKQALKDALGIKDGYFAYDPAIPEISAPPDPQDFVVCTDVLEHVEGHHLFGVLQDLQRVTKKVGFFAIHTGPALNILPDGRNAHITQEHSNWWLVRLADRWNIEAFERGNLGCWAIVTPKG